MNRRVKIRIPTKRTTQSGRGPTRPDARPWVLEYAIETKRAPEPVMGWIASGDTLNQVTLHFSTAEQAIAYAEAQGWDYEVEPARSRILKGRTYLDNFLPPPATALVKTRQ